MKHMEYNTRWGGQVNSGKNTTRPLPNASCPTIVPSADPLTRNTSRISRPTHCTSPNDCPRRRGKRGRRAGSTASRFAVDVNPGSRTIPAMQTPSFELHARRRYLVYLDGTLRDIGSDVGRAFTIDGAWYLAIGNALLFVEP